MLKEKQLNNDLTKSKTSMMCSIGEAKQKIEKMASENQIPISIENDTIKVGSLFNSKTLDCLVISHPEHSRDYYRIVVILAVGSVMMASTGVSKQMKKFAVSENAKAQRKGKSMSYKIGNMVGSSIWSLGKSKNKLEAEQAYYDALFEVIGISLDLE